MTMANDNGIQLETTIDPDVMPVYGDIGQLERALSNLVENALKFPPAGGRVCVQAYNQKSQTIIMVSDNGIGIPAENQSKVFDSFYRANQQGAEHISGTGLGLHLVKNSC